MSNETSRQEVVRGGFGHVYVSNNGHLVIDAHETDEQHLLANQTNTEQPLYTCRTYINDVIPKEWIDKFGLFVVARTIDKDGDTTAITVRFTPATLLQMPDKPETLEHVPQGDHLSK